MTEIEIENLCKYMRETLEERNAARRDLAAAALHINMACHERDEARRERDDARTQLASARAALQATIFNGPTFTSRLLHELALQAEQAEGIEASILGRVAEAIRKTVR